MKPEVIVSEERVFEGKVFALNVRQVQLSSGAQVQRDIVINKGAVVVVPLTEKQEVRLVKQYRAAVEKWIIELPAGTLEPDEDPDQAAPRELLEETGDRATTWRKLGGFYSVPGIFTEYLHIYLATGLTSGANNLEFDEHIEVITVPWAEAIAMVRCQEIEDAKTIAGLMLTGLHLEIYK